MKLFSLLSALMMIASAPAAHADAKPAQPFQCINIAYRESRIELAKNNVLTVEDTFFQDSLQGVVDALEKAEGLPKGSLGLIKASLELPMADLSCAAVGALPLDCSGRSESGILRLEAFKATEQVTFTTPVIVENYRLQARLMNSGGPIVLGSKATTVTLDKYAVTVDADVRLGSETPHFGFRSFFKTSKGPDTSSCRF